MDPGRRRSEPEPTGIAQSAPCRASLNPLLRRSGHAPMEPVGDSGGLRLAGPGCRTPVRSPAPQVPHTAHGRGARRVRNVPLERYGRTKASPATDAAARFRTHPRGSAARKPTIPRILEGDATGSEAASPLAPHTCHPSCRACSPLDRRVVASPSTLKSGPPFWWLRLHRLRGSSRR